MRFAHVATTPPKPHLARRSRVNSATKGEDTQKQTQTVNRNLTEKL